MGVRLQWGCADDENSLPRSLLVPKIVFLVTVIGDLAPRPQHPLTSKQGETLQDTTRDLRG
jgi:hypothetical protein